MLDATCIYQQIQAQAAMPSWKLNLFRSTFWLHLVKLTLKITSGPIWAKADIEPLVKVQRSVA